MGQTLTNGIYLPDEGERNCYAGLAANWNILDGAVGTVADHTTALSGKAPLVHTHTKSDITDFPAYGNAAGTICEGNDSRLSDARTPLSHTHVKSDITDLFNSDFIPSANNSYNLGSSSYQWNNLYAKNYFYNGTAWGLDKENVWSQSNRFTKSIGLGSITSYTDCALGFTGLYNILFFNTRGSTNIPSYGTYVYYGYSNVSPDRGAIIRMVRTTDRRGETNDGYIPDTSFNLYRISPEKLFIDFMEAVRVTNNGTENSIKPITNNATDLGTSDNKWKSLNGINPGALSLPDFSSNFDVSGQIIPPSGENVINTQGGKNSFTPTVNGWLSVRKRYATSIKICRETSASFGFNTQSSTDDDLCICSPVVAGTTYTIRIISSTSDNADHFRLAPCFGNV